MPQRDLQYQLDPDAVRMAQPPFRCVDLNRRRKPSWSIRDAANRQLGHANTRAGARLALRALYASAA